MGNNLTYAVGASILTQRILDGWLYLSFKPETTSTFTLSNTNVPAISILSPENKIHSENNIPLTFTVDEPTDWMGYSLDGQTNMTISANTTLIDLSEGVHVITVYANDTFGNMGYSDTVHFTVDTTPPNITSISRNPSVPNDGEAVKITVTVIDQHSDVNNVTLSYKINSGSWISITMPNTNADIYEATIPGLSAQTNIEYQIVACDGAGHQVVEDNTGSYYLYTVIPEFSSFLLLPLFVIATILAVIAQRKYARLKTAPQTPKGQ